MRCCAVVRFMYAEPREQERGFFAFGLRVIAIGKS
jgi:hypothetical protein